MCGLHPQSWVCQASISRPPRTHLRISLGYLTRVHDKSRQLRAPAPRWVYVFRRLSASLFSTWGLTILPLPMKLRQASPGSHPGGSRPGNKDDSSWTQKCCRTAETGSPALALYALLCLEEIQFHPYRSKSAGRSALLVPTPQARLNLCTAQKAGPRWHHAEHKVLEIQTEPEAQRQGLICSSSMLLILHTLQ